MGINVSTSMGFENREFLKNAARNILKKNGADSSLSEELVNKNLFGTYENSSDLSILKASTQVTLNNSLKETLNYLKAHANDKRKKEYVLGELWQSLSDENNVYKGELIDFVVDFNSKNIFAA